MFGQDRSWRGLTIRRQALRGQWSGGLKKQEVRTRWRWMNIGCHRSDAGHFMPDRSRSASKWKIENACGFGFNFFVGILSFSIGLLHNLSFFT